MWGRADWVPGLTVDPPRGVATAGLEQPFLGRMGSSQRTDFTQTCAL